MKIVIKGTPISQMRPRLGKFGVYNPQALVKQVVRKSICGQINESVDKSVYFDSKTGLSVSLVFYFQIPKNLSKAKRMAKVLNQEPCLVRNDLDNLEKFYLDCFIGVLFDDDRQIVELSSKKLWSEEPRVEVIIKDYSLLN